MNPSAFPPSRKRKIQQRLLSWFDENRRDLPWRKNRDPYSIWVSEVMLQQTQVATVLRYFEPFMRSFPTLKVLAAATEDEVLRLWEGMGYYRRAHHLHEAARRLVDEHDGRIPNDCKLFGDLPGVGRYMCGAVLSQAFERPLPIIEANSRRVMCRLFGKKRSAERKSREHEGWLWQAAEALLPAQRVGDFNQALMELGALLCTATRPNCKICPLRNCCLACRRGRQEEIPGPGTSPKEVAVQEVAVVVRRGKQVLLVQRPVSGRWPGLWEFPHDQVRNNETHETAAQRVVKDLAGLHVQLRQKIHVLKHSVTRFQIKLTCFEAQYHGGRFYSRFYRRGRWELPSRLGSFPVSAPQRKLMASLPGSKE